MPALRQLHEITRSFIKQTYQKQDKVKRAQARDDSQMAVRRIGPVNSPVSSPQSIIQDLKKNFEIVKLITGSLVCCHRLAVTAGGNNGLSGSTLVDGRYTYQEVCWRGLLWITLDCSSSNRAAFAVYGGSDVV